LSRVSGPVLDRIDIQVEVGALEFDDLQTAVACETSDQIRARVEKARTYALERFDGIRLKNGSSLTANAMMEPKHIETFCQLSEDAKELVRKAFDKLSLSARGYNRLLKVGRTIADFDESPSIKKQHIATAIRMRSLDRKYFGSV
jgi:magnesium chelatase family protein